MEAYAQLVAKLERRRLVQLLQRRPSHEELAEQFGVLLERFGAGGNLRYAAFCALAIARCERAMQDTLGEAQACAHAGHTFHLAELERSAAHAPGFEEYVGEATGCYLAAMELYRAKDMRATAASLCHELASLLLRLGRAGEAASFFLRAAETHQSIDQYHTALASLWKAVDCALAAGDSITACVTLNWVVKLASEAPDMNDALEGSTRAGLAPQRTSGLPIKTDLVAEALLTLVLVLLLQGDFQQAKDYLGKLCETTANRSAEFMSLLNDLVVR